MPYIGNITSDFSIDTGNITNRAVTATKLSPSNVGSNGQVLSIDGSGNLQWSADASGTSLTGNTNNTITTVTGANGIQGEANLTFDGSTLGVTGDVTMTNTSSNPQLALISAANGITEIQFGDTSDAVRGNIIYRSGTAGDALCFNGYNNTERMRIASDGKVGIGTTSPQRTLHLSSNNTVFALTDTAASTDQKTKYILSDAGILAFGKLNDAYDTAVEFLRFDNDGDVGIGGNGIGNGLGVYLRRSSPTTTNFYEASDGTKTMITGVDSTNDYVKIGSLSNHRVGIVTNNNEKLSILSNGAVGINRTSPNHTLEVGGNVYITSATSNANEGGGLLFQAKSGGFNSTSCAAIKGLRTSDTSSYLVFETGGTTERVRITSTGQVNIGGDFSQTSNTLNVTGNIFSSTRFNLNGAVLLWQQNRMNLGNSFIIESQQDTPFAICTQGVAQPIVLGTGTAGGAAVEHMRITSGGNVGIGTTSPAQKLDVSGNIKSTGKIYPGGNIHMPDSVGIKLGASDDFVIYHYATDGHNYIESANGQSIIFQNWNGSNYESLAKFIPDSYCQLFFNGSEKIRTTNGGVQVYGQTASNGGFYLNNGSNIVLEDNGEAQFGNSGDLTIFHDGGDSYIRQGGVGALSLESSSYVDVRHTSAGTDPVLRMVNEANTTAGALNVIRSVHDLRICAEIRMGRNNDANDFSAAAGSTQGDIQFWTTQGGSLSRKGTFINSGGLCFGTDTAAANALDDYEEGDLTWYLRKSGSTSTGNDSSSNVKYTKIGRIVHISGRVRTDSTPSDANDYFYLSGTLPFTPSTEGTSVVGHWRSQDQLDSSLTASIAWLANSTTIYLYTIDSKADYNAASNNVPASHQTNLVMTFSLTYQST